MNISSSLSSCYNLLKIQKQPLDELENMIESGWHKDELSKMMKAMDEKLAQQNSIVAQRQLTTGGIQTHLDAFGLEAEFGTYGKIKGLSGGQKVKIVMGASMWNCPHLLVLDEVRDKCLP